MHSRIASIVAWRQRFSISAPLTPSACLAKRPASTSLPKGLAFRCTLKIACLALRSGNGISKMRSNRPGRSRAGSTRSIRLVAARTRTPLSSSKPSISVRNWLITRSVTMEESPVPRRGTRESISSKNRIVGAACLAFLKTSRTPRSDSPTNLLISSGPLTEMKFTWDSWASALARRVFPVPGGP